MLKRRMWLVAAMAAMFIWHSAPAQAVSITARPDQVLFGLPGVTLGWGYDVIVGPLDGNLEFTSIAADLPAGSGSTTISVGLFDFPSLLAGTSAHLDYVPLLGSGLAQLTLSPSLLPGNGVTARVFGDYTLADTMGAVTTHSFELFVTAKVPESPAVPEPATLLLVGAGLLVAGGRVWSVRR
jgi:hypothetical protein